MRRCWKLGCIYRHGGRNSLPPRCFRCSEDEGVAISWTHSSITSMFCAAMLLCSATLSFNILVSVTKITTWFSLQPKSSPLFEHTYPKIYTSPSCVSYVSVLTTERRKWKPWVSDKYIEAGLESIWNMERTPSFENGISAPGCAASLVVRHYSPV